MQTKTCTQCGTSKTVDQFNACRDGLRSWCKTCMRERAKHYYHDNKSAIAKQRKGYRKANKVAFAEKAKIYGQANKTAISEYKKIYGQANKVAISARGKVYRQANMDKIRVRVTNRNAKKLGNGGVHTAADIKALFTLQKGKCICCRASLKDGYHVDHIYPISKEGRNDKYNLQLLCQPCNQSKSAKHPVDFMQSRGFLL